MTWLTGRILVQQTKTLGYLGVHYPKSRCTFVMTRSSGHLIFHKKNPEWFSCRDCRNGTEKMVKYSSPGPEMCRIRTVIEQISWFLSGGWQFKKKRQGKNISVTSPVLSILTRMAEDTPNPQTPQASPNTPNPQNPRRDGPPRHQGGNRRSHNNYRGHAPRTAERPAERQGERPAEKPQDSKLLSLDDEETEADRSAAPPRQSRGGGRGKPPKRVIEEWANDIYCE